MVHIVISDTFICDKMGTWFGFGKITVMSARDVVPKVVGKEMAPLAALSSSSSSSEDLETALSPELSPISPIYDQHGNVHYYTKSRCCFCVYSTWT